MQDSDIRKLDQDMRAFRSRVNTMMIESRKEATKHMTEEELPLEVPFHEGETGAYEIVLSVINDLTAKGSPISLNAIEEIYLGLLVDYKRMRGSVSALESVLAEMQNLFDLPTEEEVEQNERFAGRIKEYGQDAGQTA
jgi:hypothetical protein